MLILKENSNNNPEKQPTGKLQVFVDQGLLIIVIIFFLDLGGKG